MRALILLLFLTACSATGPTFNSISLSKSDNPALIVYRPSHVWGSGNFFEIDIDGQPTCKIYNGGFYLSKNLPKRPVEVSSSMFAVPGTSRVKIDVNQNKTYYVRIELNDSKQVAGVGAGFIGMFIAEGASTTSGPFVFTLVDESQAKEELKELRLEEKCS